MALALYRKYRPRTFAEVIGQEHVTEPLSQALRSGRLNHAYLFSGPRGCGKTSSARILARSLNCEQGPTPDPCGVCASCRSLANDGGGSIDVIEIDAASHGGVDDARELREKAFFAPVSSRYKIYVIDEAHMVSSAGFNALLKLVEEPPDYVKFIFATTEPDKVLGTIRSRTHHYPFRLIPPAVLRPYLQQLCDAEGVVADPAVLPLVVRAGGGSARDSLSILDQLIAGSGAEGVTYAGAVGLLGVTDVTLIDEMCAALADGDGAAAYATIDRVAEAGHEPRRFASDLLERFRDLIVLQQVPDAVAKGLIDGPADQLETMAGQAARLGAATLSRCADILHNGLVEMRGTTAPRLLLELVTARMLLPGADDSASALLQRLERLEQGITLSPSAAVDVRGDRPAITDSGAEALRDPAAGGGTGGTGGTGIGGGAGGGGKAAAMAAAAAAAAARGGSGRPPAGGAAARPVSPAAPAAAAVPAAPAATAVPSVSPVPAAPVSPAAAGTPGAAAPEPPGAAPGEAAAATRDEGPAPGAPVSEVTAEGHGEPDWNRIAEGGGPTVATGDGHYDEEPPWDEEPPEDEPPAPVRAEPRLASPPDDRLERIRDAWRILGQQQAKVRAMQEYGIGVREVDGDTVVFAAPTQALVDRFLNWRDAIATEFRRAPGGDWRIRCEVGEANDADPARGATRPGASADGRDQPGRRSAPGTAGRPVPQQGSPAVASSAPERNTGRTESRPSRPQRAPAADADDDWPERTRPAGPVSRDDHRQPGVAVSPDGRRAQDAGTSAAAERGSAGRSPSASPEGPSAAVSAGNSEDAAWPEPVRPGRAAPATSVTESADTGWPEPARPGASAVAAADSVSGDTGWPEPAQPGGAVRSVPSAESDEPAWPEPAKPGGGGSTAPAAGSGTGVDSGASAGSGASADSAWPEPARLGVRPDAGPSAAVTESVGGPAAGPQTGTGGGAASRPEPAAGPTPGVPASGGGVSSLGGGAGGAFGGAAVSAPRDSGPPAAPARPPAAPARSAAMEAARAAARTATEGAGSSGAAAARAALANARSGVAGRPAGGAATAKPAGAPGGAARTWSDGSPIEEAPYDPEYDGPPPPGATAAFEGFDPGDEPLDDVIDEKTARQSGEEHAMQLLREAFGAEKIGEL
ncbi:DNA polymerase III subunit gamma and tau [Actinoplanes sp. NEAU-A12]|uniref:DNA-directed DNA polymerase n=1 Tax=Actinoplanes sandaracinus TaxID=3045177 RepID=A0ABT6WYY3_9ACTN|nr:DNA polymerase III subunit gamma and tau [Actinoplanes sandaracinus]MDI6104947.1 DNA polymerase III subunit gamma and tau [Actinoplanes sandaracinus]